MSIYFSHLKFRTIIGFRTVLWRKSQQDTRTREVGFRILYCSYDAFTSINPSPKNIPREFRVTGPRTHINILSHTVDANFIYGSSDALSARLRAFDRGEAAFVDRNPSFSSVSNLAFERCMPFLWSKPDQVIFDSDRLRYELRGGKCKKEYWIEIGFYFKILCIF